MFERVEEFNMDKVIEEFELLSKDAERVQRETLKKILEDNASAEYLQSLGLNGRTDPESFKACVPMVTHKELEPYIYRIIDGDASPILTGKPITTMSLRCIFFFFLSVFLSLNCCAKFLNGILAVLAPLRGSQNMYPGTMNCMKPQCRYTRPLLPLETGISPHFSPLVSINFCVMS